MASTKLTRLLFLCVLFLIPVAETTAQTTCDLHTGSEVEVCRQTVIQAGPFSGKAIYNSGAATVNNHNVELLIYLQGDGVESVASAKCESIDEPKIRCDQAVPISLPEESPRTVVFKVRVSISDGVDPKAYPLTLKFWYQGQEVTAVAKPLLFVGITNHDPAKPKVRFETRQKHAPVIYTGVDNTLRLTIKNEYHDYSVHIHSINSESDPAHLTQLRTQKYRDPTIQPQDEKMIDLTIPAGAETQIEIPVAANSLNFTNLIGGFTSPEILLSVRYDDGYGRKVTFSQNIPANFRPRDWVLVIWMFFGVLVGALIKLSLQRLQQAGQISRRQVLVFVITTMGMGVVVAAIAMVGRIQIIAFDTTGSYDRPLVIFAIALAGAVGGAQLLSMWLNRAPAKKD